MIVAAVDPLTVVSIVGGSLGAAVILWRGVLKPLALNVSDRERLYPILRRIAEVQPSVVDQLDKLNSKVEHLDDRMESLEGTVGTHLGEVDRRLERLEKRQ